KFPEADCTLVTQMKSVGEVMSIGRTFKESLQKAMRSLEIGLAGFEPIEINMVEIKSKLTIPNAERLWYIGEAFRKGMSISEIHELTSIDPWFLYNIQQIIDKEELLLDTGFRIRESADLLRAAKEYGFSDKRIAQL